MDAKTYLLVLLLLWFCACRPSSQPLNTSQNIDGYELIVLGVAQDAGYPQINCKKTCCADLWTDFSKRKMVSY